MESMLCGYFTSHSIFYRQKGPASMLLHHTFNNIPTLAFRHPLVGGPKVGFHGGPVIQQPEWQALRHTRYFHPFDWFDGFDTISDRLAGDYVYVGPVYNHFGHVMSEMVHRLLPAAESLKGRSILLISTVDDQRHLAFETLPHFYQDILRFFSIDPSRVVILNQDRIVERLHVYQQGSDFGGGPKPGYLDDLRAFADNLLERNPTHQSAFDKVYVSRSALPGGGGLLGERYVERLLEEHGFHIARPETMPLIEQMQLYRHAKVIIFPEGSACHGVELLGAESLGTVVFLARRRDHMEIFRRILAPRSRHYIAIDPPPGTGTILSDKQHNTIGVIDISTLLSTLGDTGFVGNLRFDIDAYVSMAETDFARHVVQFATSDPLSVDGALLIARANAFAEMFKSMRDGGPVRIV